MPLPPEDSHFRGDASREQFRAEMMAKIPRWYSPIGHFLGTAGVGVAATALAVSQIHALRWVELAIVPIVFVLSNLAEWHAHRNLLHRRWPLMGVLYDRHTPEHHRVYRYRDMALREVRELRLVLIPAAGVLGIVVSAVAPAAAVGWLLGANVGWLFLLTSALYVVSYELTHLSYHMPEDSFVGRRRFVRWMREHHARHHDPRLMQKWNFNVTVPLGDWLFGTLAPAELVAEIQGRAPTPRVQPGVEAA